MRRLWMGVALILMAHAAFAAVQYEFIQTSRSDADGMPPMNMSAKAVIDGPRSRVDFLSGNAYPPGTYVISTDGARKLRFVDPGQKTYTEVNTMTIASAIGMNNIKVENLESSVARLDDQQMIAGIPTDHYKLSLTFDVTVIFSGRPLRQHFRAEIDKWTTSRFGDVTSALASATLETGNQQIDELIAAETTKISGFPLKQSVRITAMNALMDKQRPGKSKLSIPTSTTLTREITITSIRETKGVEEALFAIPAGYTRAEFAERMPKSQTQVLTFEPQSD
ncbi:MAG TPA: hypothetical protein VM779_06160 [Thermoanaerobaculia bacterium]|nr:hypothetical protein [Thermoanaerobaculia bacterium]